ncbi:MAG TPA: MarR family transcriptional regulator [Candidatus Saccharimonadales bacterium]|nr:MarR family transcriptional regulator [Candidatus Saccharimonadales bacterium]
MIYTAYESGILFNRAHAAVYARISAVLSRYNLTASDWSILVFTEKAPEGIRLASVARSMNVKAPLVTMLVNDLIKQGYVKRIPHHTDGRAKLLIMTSHGSKVLNQISQQMDDQIKELTQGVSAEDMKIFTRCLEVILKNAG